MEKETTQKRGRIRGLLRSMPDYISNNIWLLLEILACIIFYIGNRYAYERDQAYAERLRRELVDMEYQTLNSTSDVSAKSKPSYIEKIAIKNGSGLQPVTESPYKLPK